MGSSPLRATFPCLLRAHDEGYAGLFAGSDSSDSGSDDEAVSRRENVGDTSTFHQGG